MHGRDPHQTLIVGVEGAGDRRETRHEPVHRRFAVIGPLQQAVDFIAFTDDKTAAASLDQRRVSEQQTLVGAGEPVDYEALSFAQAPEMIYETSVS